MSIQSPAHVPPRLPGQVAVLALAAGLGVIVGVGVSPLWGNDAARTATTTVRIQDAQPRIAAEGAAVRAHEARLESVLHDGHHFRLGFSPVREVVVVERDTVR